MSCELAISLLLSSASLQPGSGSLLAPLEPHGWGLSRGEPRQVLTSLGEGLGSPPGSQNCCQRGNESSSPVPAQGMARTPQNTNSPAFPRLCQVCTQLKHRAQL